MANGNCLFHFYALSVACKSVLLCIFAEMSSPKFKISYIAAINCGDPGTPTNGQRSLSSTTYNSVVTYTCDVGYTLQGSNSRTCQSDRQWSGSVPQCQRMLKTDCFLASYWNVPIFASMLSKSQPSVPVPAKMEEPAQLLTYAPVTWGGLECSVKQVLTERRLVDVLGSVTYHSPVQSIVCYCILPSC